MIDHRSKIVLINPSSLHAWEALGLGYLASFSYKFGYRPEQYSFYAGEFDSDDEILAGCADAAIVGFSLTSFQIAHGLHLGREIRKVNPRVKIIWGGYGVSGLTAEQLREMVKRYEELARKAEQSDEGLQELEETLKSLGLRPRAGRQAGFLLQIEGGKTPSCPAAAGD